MLPVFAALLLQTSSNTVQVNVDGVMREAMVIAPRNPSAHPPVVFAFHGHMGTPTYASRSFDVQDAWPEAVVVYPKGVPTVSRIDPTGRYPGWNVELSESNPDLRFFDALYRSVMATYHGDPQRVFALGHSNGGYLIYTLWAMRPDKFAGLASSEAAGATRTALKPKPIFVTIGSRDKIVSPVVQRNSFQAVLRADQSTQTTQQYGSNGSLYGGSTPVVLWSYDGGHTFPKDCIPEVVRFFKGLGQ